MIDLAPDLELPVTTTQREYRSPGSSPASNLFCVGVSFRTAPVALRERLALSPDTTASMLSRFGCDFEASTGDVSELVVLSTCNRLELYASGSDAAPAALIALIEEATSVPVAELLPVVYQLHGTDTVRHLCRTAAGLDSMVLGEPQILGQVSNAFSAAVAQRAAGHALSTMFRGAIRAGRRARSETGINRQPATVSSAAVKLVASVIPSIADAKVLVIGAGQMAELAVNAFHQRGSSQICIASRTADHAAELGNRFGARSTSLQRLQQEIAAADVVIASSAAPHHIVSRSMIEAVMEFRPARPLAIVDIALPRNVDPEVRSVTNVSCWDLDDLQHSVAAANLEREAEVPRVESVVEDEARQCVADLRQLDVQPLIADLRAHMERVRHATLERALRGLPDLSDAERARIEGFSQSLVNKLFHEPMVRLREEAQHGQAAGYAMAVRHLFGLSA